MNRLLRAVAVPVVSLAVAAGCQHMKNAEHKTENMMGMNKDMAVAHMMPAGAASTQPAMGHVMGDVTFKQSDGKMKIHAELTGLPPGAHGIHIHEKGDLSAADLSSAGGHYDPEMHKMHGAPNTSAMVHAGDLGNIMADSSGKATFDLTVSDLSIGGTNDILGKSVIIHAKEDDLHTQQSGNSGARIAGGVIEQGK
jgi:Cu-Zn family superoxide dismutase